MKLKNMPVPKHMPKPIPLCIQKIRICKRHACDLPVWIALFLAPPFGYLLPCQSGRIIHLPQYRL